MKVGDKVYVRQPPDWTHHGNPPYVGLVECVVVAEAFRGSRVLVTMPGGWTADIPKTAKSLVLESGKTYWWVPAEYTYTESEISPIRIRSAPVDPYAAHRESLVARGVETGASLAQHDIKAPERCAMIRVDNDF